MGVIEDLQQILSVKNKIKLLLYGRGLISYSTPFSDYPEAMWPLITTPEVFTLSCYNVYGQLLSSEEYYAGVIVKLPTPPQYTEWTPANAEDAAIEVDHGYFVMPARAVRFRAQYLTDPTGTTTSTTTEEWYGTTTSSTTTASPEETTTTVSPMGFSMGQGDDDDTSSLDKAINDYVNGE